MDNLIMKLLIFLMLDAEKIEITGKQKKAYVMKQLKELIIFEDESNILESFIESVIDHIILVDRNKLKIRKFNLKKMLTCNK